MSNPGEPQSGSILSGFDLPGIIRIPIPGTSKAVGAGAVPPLRSTVAAQTAARLFDDAAWPWCLQAQVTVLSARDAAVPDIARSTLLSLIDDDWARRAAPLRSLGVAGVMRAGVNGDVAGVLSLDDTFTRALLDAIEHETRCSDFACLRLSEHDFIDLLGTSPAL